MYSIWVYKTTSTVRFLGKIYAQTKTQHTVQYYSVYRVYSVYICVCLYYIVDLYNMRVVVIIIKYTSNETTWIFTRWTIDPKKII